MIRGVLPYFGDNLLLLDELADVLDAHGVREPVLLRASEIEKLDKLLAHGTDRGGYAGNRRWRHDPAIAHEDVILATTPAYNRAAERELERSSSLKKFAIIERPLLLVYDAAAFEQLRATEYRFRNSSTNGSDKRSSLLAVFEIARHALPDGWFTGAEGRAYRALARAATDDPQARGVIVEVGCWLGRSTSYLASLVRTRGSKLICVDHWAGSTDDYDTAYRERLAARDVAAAFRDWLDTLAVPAEILHTPSLQAAARVADGSVDLVFLDASHDEAAVAADIAAWSPKLREQGVLAGHDYDARHPGVVAAVDRATQSRGCVVERGPGSLWSLRLQGSK